jgi:hypothetical protein
MRDPIYSLFIMISRYRQYPFLMLYRNPVYTRELHAHILYDKIQYSHVEHAHIQLFQLRLSPEQSGKVEYERERLLGITNKSIHLLANPSSLSRSYSTFPLCSGDKLN